MQFFSSIISFFFLFFSFYVKIHFHNFHKIKDLLRDKICILDIGNGASLGIIRID